MRPALLEVAIAALAVASGASAKNMTVAQACGPHDCVRLEDRQALTTLLGGGGSTQPPTAEYYRLDFSFESPDGAHRVTHSSLYIPLTHLAATEGRSGDVVWFPVDRAAAGPMERATRDLQPFAAPSAWPTRYADRLFTRTSRTAEGNGAGWTQWLPAGLAVLLALGAAAFLAQARLRRPSWRETGLCPPLPERGSRADLERRHLDPCLAHAAPNHRSRASGPVHRRPADAKAASAARGRRQHPDGRASRKPPRAGSRT